MEADTLIIATGAIAKRLHFKGAEALWNRGISACAVCDGAAPIFRGRPLAVVGGGDTAMEEANFLSKYGSKVFLIHRRGQFRASKVMQERVFKNPKIEVVWDTVVEEARERADGKGLLGALAVRNLKTGKESQLEARAPAGCQRRHPTAVALKASDALSAPSSPAVEASTAHFSRINVAADGCSPFISPPLLPRSPASFSPSGTLPPPLSSAASSRPMRTATSRQRRARRRHPSRAYSPAGMCRTSNGGRR